MRRQLCGIAAAVGLAFAAGAHAQSSSQSDAGPSFRDQAFEAQGDRINDRYRKAKEECESKRGNAQDLCEKRAEARRNVDRAELAAHKNPTPQNQRKVAEAKAEAEYAVEREKCDGKPGSERTSCQKEAKAQFERAKARFRSAATGSSR